MPNAAHRITDTTVKAMISMFFMLNSLDDPLSPPDCFPSDKELSSPFLNFFTTEKGGHVAFVSRDTSYWLEKQILRWFLFNIN